MKPRVAVVTTGGTIGQRSGVDGRSSPGADLAPLIAAARPPGVQVEVIPVLAKGSMDFRPEDWALLAEKVAESLQGGVDGVVVLHGTDTLHYTAAALSFMLAGLSVPVVLTGSMIPGGDPGSDALPNLRDALYLAAYADVAEVCVVFSEDGERNTGVVIRGTRARKVHSGAIDAFASVGLPPLGRVRGDTVTWAGDVEHLPRGRRELIVAPEVVDDVILVKVTPALRVPGLRRMLSTTRGAVIEGTGVGHVPSDWVEVLAEYRHPVVVSTQTCHGGERLGSYASDQLLLALPNVTPAGSMTPETCLVKLMWSLAHGDPGALMQADLAGELRS